MTGAMATKAAAVAKVPSFQWLDRNVTIDTLLARTLSQIRAANNAGANPPYAGKFGQLSCMVKAPVRKD
jgi:cellulose 1,4-beta-cellobiosidase